MTVKELIDRLNEFKCPDYEVKFNDGTELNSSDIRFSEVGAKISIGLPQKSEKLTNLITELKDCYYDIESALENLSDISDDLEELI